jgi:DNA-binding Xre family transcriptional regulator
MMMKIKVDYNKLDNILIEKGMTRADLSRKINHAAGFISANRIAGRELQDYIVKAICDALQITEYDFCCLDKQKDENNLTNKIDIAIKLLNEIKEEIK